MEKDAETNAYQECRSLMLSPTTHAVPIPGPPRRSRTTFALHGHAATVGRVNRETLLFYWSRGLTLWEAERLIVPVSIQVWNGSTSVS